MFNKRNGNAFHGAAFYDNHNRIEDFLFSRVSIFPDR